MRTSRRGGPCRACVTNRAHGGIRHSRAVSVVGGFVQGHVGVRDRAVVCPYVPKPAVVGVSTQRSKRCCRSVRWTRPPEARWWRVLLVGDHMARKTKVSPDSELTAQQAVDLMPSTTARSCAFSSSPRRMACR